ncbi:hypothetical protein EMCG_02179 [[Emmonsia] crescens]|uniref:Uncharacterized protein n=1 Tax=[Emmonsia] crescens TaxID=73230 RepID=A0A0G2I083_9EURO|nr:hypothetical protein EMCG_02179 [Emmonsia crescens UAMH 3008]
MKFDHIAEDQLDIVFAQWLKQLLAKSSERLAMELAYDNSGGTPQSLSWRSTDKTRARFAKSFTKRWLSLSSKRKFPKIGALREEPNEEFTVLTRQYTFNMNELTTSANVPPCVLPNTTFE